MDKVSIIIPVYNVEDYLEECLNSIKNQIYKNIEILLIDDGSTDNSPEICDRYSELDNRFFVFHRKNSGVSSARNFGLDNATGKFIMFVDSDDYVSENFVKLAVDSYEESAFVTFGYTELYKKKSFEVVSPINYSYMNDLSSLFFMHNYIGGFCWNKLYLKEIIDTNLIRFDSKIKICEDLYFNLNYLQYVDSLKVINKRLYFYRMRGNSATWNINNEKIVNHINCLDEVQLLLEKNNKVDDSFLYYKLLTVFKYRYNLSNYSKVFLKLLISKNILLKSKIKLFIFRYFFFIYKFYMKKKINNFVLFD